MNQNGQQPASESIKRNVYILKYSLHVLSPLNTLEFAVSSAFRKKTSHIRRTYVTLTCSVIRKP